MTPLNIFRSLLWINNDWSLLWINNDWSLLWINNDWPLRETEINPKFSHMSGRVIGLVLQKGIEGLQKEKLYLHTSLAYQ